MLKTRLSIIDLEKLPHGPSQEVTLMQAALQAERARLQLLVGEPTSPRGSEAKGSVSSGTSEAGKAKIEALKRAVGAAEAFLLTEESQGQDFALLKKLEILERTLGSTVDKLDNSQGRLQLAPAEADEVEQWQCRGNQAVGEIVSREFRCSAIPPSTQGMNVSPYLPKFISHVEVNGEYLSLRQSQLTKAFLIGGKSPQHLSLSGNSIVGARFVQVVEPHFVCPPPAKTQANVSPPPF